MTDHRRLETALPESAHSLAQVLFFFSASKERTKMAITRQPPINNEPLRRRLQQRLPSPAEFEVFCQDRFSQIHRLFTRGMARTEQENLLIDAIAPDEIHQALTQHTPLLARLLTDGLADLPPSPSPAQLLQARYRVVPFYEAGRREVLDQLQTWCEGPRPIAVRLFYGPGGAGKTRLLLEWCERLSKADWTAGLLPKRVDAGRLATALSWGGDALLAIDYAELRPDLGELLRAIAQSAGRPGRLRVVLLARGTGDWWQERITRDSELEPLLSACEPTRIPPLANNLMAREAIFMEAARSFAMKLNCPIPVLSTELTHERYSRVLYLHMAALLAVLGERHRTDELLERILDHEESFFLQHLRTHDADELEQRAWREQIRKILAALTLRGGSPSQESLRSLLRDLHRQEPLPGSLDRLQTTLDLAIHSLYGAPASASGEQPYAVGLEPDLLGEAMVYRALWHAGRDAPLLLERLLTGATPLELRQGFVVLGNLSSRFSAQLASWLREFLLTDLPQRVPVAFEAAKVIGKETAETRLGDILANVLVESGTLALAQALYDAGLPEHTVSLGDLCCWVIATKLESLPAEDHLRGERARLLMQLGTWQSSSRQRQSAPISTQKAVALYRELAAEQAETFLSDLAASLVNLGSRQAEAGDWAAALKSTEEGTNYFRELVAKRLDSCQPSLAASLTNLGSRQSELGNKKEALAAAQEAADLYDLLFRKHPAEFQHLLAASLTNLSNRQLEAGTPQEALHTAQRAVDLYQELADRQPDAFTPNLGLSLTNLSLAQDKCGNLEACLRLLEAAVKIFRPLSAILPQVHLPNLARNLTTLADVQYRLGHRAQGLASGVEAVERCKTWAVHEPIAACPVLARAFRVLGHLHTQLGDLPSALQAIDEGLKLDQQLAAQVPSVYLPDLLISLNNRGFCLHKLGRSQEALAPLQQAIEQYQTLRKSTPDAFDSDLALALANQTEAQAVLRRWTDAAGSCEETIKLYRVLSQRQLDLGRPRLGSQLMSLVYIHCQLGQYAAAMTPALEAQVIFQALAEKSPDVFRPQLAHSLHNLGFIQHMLDRQPEAIVCLVDAVAIYESLIAVPPDQYADDLAQSLWYLGNAQAKVGQTPEAVRLLGRAAELRRGLAVHQAGRFGAALVETLTQLGFLQGQLGLFADAISNLQEAVVVGRPLCAQLLPGFRLFVARSLGNIGLMHGEQGKFAEADARLREAAAEYLCLGEELRAAAGDTASRPDGDI